MRRCGDGGEKERRREYHPSGRYPSCIMRGTYLTFLLTQYSPSNLQFGESLYFWLMHINTTAACSMANATFKSQRKKEEREEREREQGEREV